jgi:mannosyltransferase
MPETAERERTSIRVVEATAEAPSRRTLPVHRIVLAGILILAAALRLATIDHQSYWFDEAVTVDLVRDSLWGMLGRIPGSESTPPLFYVLAWLWSKVFGTGEAGLRSLSALFGVGAVAGVYLAGAKLASARAGLIAASLAAVSPFLIWYSQEARAYELLALLSALSLAFLFDALKRPTDRPLVGWAVVSSLALATHYFAVFTIVPQAVLLLARSGRRRAATFAVGGVGLTLIALAPLLLYQRG